LIHDFDAGSDGWNIIGKWNADGYEIISPVYIIGRFF